MKMKIKLAVLLCLMGLGGRMVFAVTNDNTTGSSAAIPAYEKQSALVQTTVSFVTTPAASNDVYKVVPVPANTLVEWVTISVVSTSSCSGAYAVDVGDSVTRNGYIANVILSAVGSAMSTTNSTTYLGGKLYTNSIYSVDIRARDTITNGSVTVSALLTKFK